MLIKGKRYKHINETCSTCSNVAVITCATNPDACIGTDQPVTQTAGTNGDGCRTITVTCTSATAGSQVVFFWTQQGADRGTSQGVTTVTRTLVCDANGDLILTEPAPGGSGIVDEVQCVSP
uniref:Ig-like domain-containing protein n=1 Tax=Panagrolaimus sp. PS1159 TaxID=55785 RepID=A0AC35FW16_9BILA